MTKNVINKKNSRLAVIYTRVSSADQVEGTSLATQLDACRSCAARLGLEIVSEHQDAGKSAKTVVGRDALAAAVDSATSTGSTLIVYKFDRLSRNLGDGYDLRDMLVAKGCRIVSATEGEASSSPVSKAMYAMMMAFAELDNDMRSERCHAGMVARAVQGGWNSNPPVGFLLSRNQAGISVLVPDGVQSEILRSAFLDFISGKTTKGELILRLKGAGHPDSTITRIIRSPVYGGIIRNTLTGGEDIKAAFPGLITQDQWYIMESMLSGGSRAKLKNNPAFPYTGTVVCAICGKPLRSGFTRSKGRLFGYYFCRTAGHVKIKRSDLHDQVAAMLVEIGKVGPFLQLVKEAVSKRELADPCKDLRQQHQRNAARLEPQLVRLRSALLDGTFTPAEYEAEKVRLNGQLAESRAWLDANSESTDRRAEWLDLLIRLFSDPSSLLEKLTVAQTKALIRIMFKSFTLDIGKKIEPSQDSVYRILTTVHHDLFLDGRPGGSRTRDPQIRNLVLCPTELQACESITRCKPTN